MEFCLHEACKAGDAKIVNKILSTNKYLLAVEDPFQNWTPIHWAAYNGHLECLRLVASIEPSTINIQSSKTFQTPLHCAAEGGHPECVLWLLQAGVNPEVKDGLGETAFHKAAKSGSAECIYILISATSNVSVQNSNGQTASMLAEMGGFSDIASLIRQREIPEMNVFNNRNVTTGPYVVGPRLNRKRTRDMCDLDSPFKRQRSFDLTDIPLPSSTLVSNSSSLHSSVMEHEDLCGSEIHYNNTLLDSMIQEYHGC